MRLKRNFRSVVGGVAVLVLLTVSTAEAQPWGRGEGGRGEGPHGHDHFDGRFNHNHYYPERGYAVGFLPREHFVVNYRSDRFFYAGGVWYAPRGPRFVVVAPPVGAFVPILPGFYTTVWFGGIPYYYANDAYYVWREGPHSYEVVEPPDEQSATTQAPVNDEVFIYPKNGQNEEQQARDKYECHKWASNQSGFDPTQSAGGVPPEQTNSQRAGYHRAMAACLEARGYSVK